MQKPEQGWRSTWRQEERRELKETFGQSKSMMMEMIEAYEAWEVVVAIPRWSTG
jgi:hypothetical protein